MGMPFQKVRTWDQQFDGCHVDLSPKITIWQLWLFCSIHLRFDRRLAENTKPNTTHAVFRGLFVRNLNTKENTATNVRATQEDSKVGSIIWWMTCRSFAEDHNSTVLALSHELLAACAFDSTEDQLKTRSQIQNIQTVLRLFEGQQKVDPRQNNIRYCFRNSNGGSRRCVQLHLWILHVTGEVIYALESTLQCVQIRRN